MADTIDCPNCGAEVDLPDDRAVSSPSDVLRTTDLDEAGQRRPDWKQLDHLVTAARLRGWDEAQLQYLQSCLGICWAKATFATEAAIIDGTHPLIRKKATP